VATSVIRYRKDGNLWVPLKFAGGTSSTVNRDALVAGVHRPNDPNYVGPYSVTTWQDVFPTGGNTHITLGVGTGGPLGDAHYGKRYWGQVRITSGLADWSVKFRECQFHGQDPATVSSADPGIIRCYGTTPTKFEVWDSLIDPKAWVDERGAADTYPKSMGFHGANFRVRRTEVRNVQDPFNLVGPNGIDPVAVTDQETLIELCWIHKGDYANNVYPPSDGQPHSDPIQWNTGRNYTVRGNYIGGQRDMTGFWTWPTGGAAPYVGEGYNAGDDFFAALMLRQEVDNSDTNRLENILIEKNWFEGGAYGINHYYDPTRPNTFSTTTVQDNRFIPRPVGSNWNRTYYGTGFGQPSQLVVLPSSWYDGFYILRSNAITATYSNNVNDVTGAPVPIQNGG
jgi:hypothetical protein